MTHSRAQYLSSTTLTVTIHCASRLLFSKVLLLSFLIAFNTNANAFHLPLWQFGLGAGVISAPHYRGSKSVEEIYLPIPYVIYRGDFLKVDRDGIRSELFDSDRLRLDISLAGNIPVPKSDDSARAGMPSLDPLIEIGPELEVNLWDSGNGKSNVWLKFPLRLVFSVGDPIMDYQGWSFSPYLNYQLNWRKFRSLTRMNLSIGPIFAANKYHDYFYKVDPEFVTPDRQEYNANSGYSGSRITMALSKNTRDYFIGAFARYDNLQNATFNDSPLVETGDYFIFGIAFAWIFSAASETVPHDD